MRDFRVLVFSAAVSTYPVPETNQALAGVTRAVSCSTLNSGAVGSVVTYWYGLLPAHSTADHGRAFSPLCEFGAATSSGVGDFVFCDADILRDSGERAGDEVIPTDPATAPQGARATQLNVRAGVEVAATVQFADGSTRVGAGGAQRVVRPLLHLHQLPVRSGRARSQRQADRRDRGRADGDPQSTRIELARTGLLVVILRVRLAGAALGPTAGRQSDPGRPRPYPMMVQVRPIPGRYVGDRR